MLQTPFCSQGRNWTFPGLTYHTEKSNTMWRLFFLLSACWHTGIIKELLSCTQQCLVSKYWSFAPGQLLPSAQQSSWADCPLPVMFVWINQLTGQRDVSYSSRWCAWREAASLYLKVSWNEPHSLFLSPCMNVRARFLVHNLLSLWKY